ncbi:MAG: Methyltransferase domain [Rhodobacteraceae bacterium HLUCCA08]|nr:MAG: Methyltransferase domain [Rhodobacteraceae bacterium HLUCCA08]
MVDTAKFWDRAARKYAAAPIRDMASYEYTLERTRSHLRPDHRVLELGCGTGSTALLLADAVAAYTGTDISGQMIRIAREKAAAGPEGLHFEVAGAGDAVRGTASCDVVLGLNLLHLLRTPEAVLRDAHARLSEGGLVITKTVCLAEPSLGPKRFAFAALIPLMRAVGKAPFVQRFTFAGLERMIQAAGFELIETGTGPAMSRYIVARKR